MLCHLCVCRQCHHQEYSNYKTTLHHLSLTTSSPVLLTGIRLSLAPGSQISVRISLSSALSSRVVLDKGKVSNEGCESEAKVVIFAQEFPLVPNLLHEISVEVCGRGSAGTVGFSSANRTQNQTEKTRSSFSAVLENQRRSSGGARDLAGGVVFTIAEDQSQIHELFYQHLHPPTSHKSPAFNLLKKK